MYVVHKDSKLRRARINHLCQELGCTLQELKEKYPEYLSNGIRCQLNYMLYQERKNHDKKA